MGKTKIAIISLSIVFLWFLFQWNVDLNFQSYDPGWYYWVALWFKLLNSHDIFALRVAVTSFLVVSIYFGLLIFHNHIRSISVLCIAAILLIVWMSPNFRYFDSGIGLISIYFLKIFHPQLLQQIEITEEHIWVDILTAQIIKGVTSIFESGKENDVLLITPDGSTFYPILNRQSPWWNTCSLFPESISRQIEMIAQLQEGQVIEIILGNSAL